MGLCLPPGKSWVCVTSTEKLGNQLTYRDPEIYQGNAKISQNMSCVSFINIILMYVIQF